jgi:hypothetical protein
LTKGQGIGYNIIDNYTSSVKQSEGDFRWRQDSVLLKAERDATICSTITKSTGWEDRLSNKKQLNRKLETLNPKLETNPRNQSPITKKMSNFKNTKKHRKNLACPGKYNNLIFLMDPGWRTMILDCFRRLRSSQ